MSSRYPSLRHWRPTTHDYRGQAIGIYDEALLLVDAGHIRVGDYVLVGSRAAPARFRVRHLAYHPAPPAYWRVQIERVSDVLVHENAAAS